MQNDHDTDHVQRLSRLVSDRISELGHTTQSLADLTSMLAPKGKGLSPRTITELRRPGGDTPTPNLRTQRLLERALSWGDGSIQEVLDGGDPFAPEERDETATLTQLAREVRELRERLDSLTTALSRAFG